MEFWCDWKRYRALTRETAEALILRDDMLDVKDIIVFISECAGY